MQSDQLFMSEALCQAEAGLRQGELPIGAVLVAGNRVLARARARDRERGSRIAHAELELLLGPWDRDCPRGRLTLYTTLEPCVMCLAAIMTEGIGRVVYGLTATADGGLILLQKEEVVRRCGPPPLVTGGICEHECRSLFQRFVALPDSQPGMVAFAAAVLDQRQQPD